MKLNRSFEIVQVADDWLAVPVGELARSLRGIVALSEGAAYLMQHAPEECSEEELVQMLLDEYDVDAEAARADVRGLVEKLRELGLIAD